VNESPKGLDILSNGERARWIERSLATAEEMWQALFMAAKYGTGWRFTQEKTTAGGSDIAQRVFHGA
jgi:hypothetical protein